MFHPRFNRDDKNPIFDFPTTKLKNISCAYCRHEFIIRDFSNLRGPSVPLLLSCGHAACHHCVKIHSSDPCPLCRNSPSVTANIGESSLPINVYIVGLLSVNRARPLGKDEPDLSFSKSLRTRAKERSDNELCRDCNAIAAVRCLQCVTVYCHMCAEKIHSKMSRPDEHFRVLLTNTNNNSVFSPKVCREHADFLEYYCIECDSSHCSKCIVHHHQQHRVITQVEKNKEHVEDFQKVHAELVETLQRIRQTQKKLEKKLVFPEESESNEIVETAINQYFAHVHGALQNIERRMIDKLSKHRNSITANLSDMQTRLKKQEGQLQSALMMAATLNEVIGRIDLRDVISGLGTLADVPCHLVRDPIVNDEKIKFCPDPDVIKTLESHCKIEIPSVSEYSLLRSSALPMDYQAEPLDKPREIPSLFDESLNASTLQRAPSCQSVCSRRPEPQAFREGNSCFVYVCYIENPSNFYVRRQCYHDQIRELEHQLATYAHSFNEPDEVQINKIYAVRHATKNKWYRGRVTAITRNAEVEDTYQMFDVDYGRTEAQVTISQVRSLSDELLSIPQMAINCAFHDIVPFDGKWHSQARKFMIEATKSNQGRDLIMRIVKVIGNTHYVDICQDQVSIRDCLIYLGHGSFVTTQYLRRTCPRSVRTFFREGLELEKYFKTMCSHVESPDCIYVQKAGDHLHFLCTLTSEMSQHYNHMKAKNNSGIIYLPEVGLPCAVEQSDGQWYRGTIHAVPRPRMVEVFLVDFGSRITLTYDKIRQLDDRFMIAPTQAIKVALTDVKPRAGEWCEDAIKFTKKRLEHKYVRVFGFEEKDKGYGVALYIDDEANHDNFAALLAGSGLAISTGPRSSGYARVVEKRASSTNRKLRNSRTNGKKKTKSRKLQLTRQVASDMWTNDPYRLLVKIAHAVSPDEIYISDMSQTGEYERMMTEMQKFYNKYKDTSNRCDWRVDSPCVVYSAGEQSFCRGTIVGFESTGEAQVFLYDLAVTDTYPIVELQTLNKKFAMIPPYVCKVKLAGILPCGGSSVWPSSSCRKLLDIVWANQHSKFYITKVVTPDDEALNVDLWVEEVKIDGPLAPARYVMTSINRELVDEGLALPIRQYNEKKTTVLAVDLRREISFVDDASKNESADFGSNENFKVRRSNDSVASKKIECTNSFVSSASSELSIDENEISDANSYVDSPTSNENLSIANDTAGTLTLIEPEFDAWLPADPIPDDNFTAVVTNVDYACSVYLYPKRQANMINFIEETLSAIYSSMKAEPQDLEWKTGDLCIAQYHLNKKWYRAEVLRTLDNDMIEVALIDYGSIEECENGTLRKRLALTDIPRQCTKCEIAGLVPDTPNGKWRVAELDRIHGLIVDKECEVTVLERKLDRLVVSVVLSSPTRRELVSYLINDLRLTVRTDIVHSECAINESQSTINKSGDVIIDGYVKDPASEEEIVESNHEVAKNAKDVGEENNENREASAKSIIEENGILEEKDIHETTKNPEDTLEEIDNDLSSYDIVGAPFTIDDVSAYEIADSLHKSEDLVISGTANFTLSADQIEISQREARSKLESDELSDNNSIREDQVVASTPIDDSLNGIPTGYKTMLISKDLSPVKAEVALVGLTKVWLHLLRNEKSVRISKFRDLYEKIMQDMQDCASEQPILEDFKENTPCCAKFVDGKWYRCKVLKCLSDPRKAKQMVQVRFIDWGNETLLRCDEVRTLKEEWLETPCMALRCRLWGIVEGPSINTDDIGTTKVQRAWKVDKKPPPPVYIKIQGRSRNFHDVEVYSDKECQRLVYQSLLDDGFFLKENSESD